MAEKEIKKSMTPNELAMKIVEVLDSKGANDVKALHVEKSTIIADYYVICTGNSNTHIKTLAGEVEMRLTELENPPANIEGRDSGSWILLDFSSVIVHIFSNEAREFYKLEKLWSGAQDVDISSVLPNRENLED